ncbi:lytic polysaccharide monooxygenase [Actinokineospora sp. PR83]|uniref:lytic polysaccharide monooxygenase n=1 Tax=Actinokineospora sp. PR83 TaxID=2884908 RepID=UPI001F45F84D|nr:lytic polysaccharide monooxygenase [Actinokineospora sp. PR83]MCG8916601.1 lytic polysaccharide monooxygenase [Actinokineospora sp. PR83]
MHATLSAPRRRTALHIAVLLSVVASLLSFHQTRASAHGTVVDPPTRNYGCATRWSGPDAPGMQEQDPMCHLAWHQSPDAMYNWNALYANNLGEDIEHVVPNGQICSAGRAEAGRYGPMDNPGPWRMTKVGSTFPVQVQDVARHGADYLKIYITKQGFDPATSTIGWNNLDFIKQTGRYPSQLDYRTEVNTSGYTGRHVVITVWKASHMDQKYFLCSDVDFG